MNLKQIRYFCEVVEAGSAVQAASQLFVAPTAISMQISQLEVNIGGVLFDRSKRPMELTALGKYYYPRAKELLVLAKKLEKEAQEVALGKGGCLSIGFVRSVLFSVLPQTLRIFREMYPTVHIDLSEVITDEQPFRLRDGSIDIGIARFLGEVEKTSDLSYNQMFYDPFVAVLPINHPLSDQESVTIEQLKEQIFITYPKSHQSAFGQKLISLVRQGGDYDIVNYDVVEIHTALALVAAGLGWTLVTRSVSFNNRSDIVFLPVDGIQTTTSMIAVTRQGELNKLVDIFMSLLANQYDIASKRISHRNDTNISYDPKD